MKAQQEDVLLQKALSSVLDVFKEHLLEVCADELQNCTPIQTASSEPVIMKPVLTQISTDDS